ncbi:hypothetical protein YC2023_065963 [Brassica napus]
MLDAPPGSPKNCPKAKGGFVRVHISLSRPVSFFMVKPRSWSKFCDSDRIVPNPSRSASGPWCWVGRPVMFLFDCWLAGWPFISNPGCWMVDRKGTTRSGACGLIRLSTGKLTRSRHIHTLADRPGSSLKFHRDGDRSLQLLVFNEEFLVSASHELALTTSLPFVHTARRSYRLNDPVKCSDRDDVGGLPSATSREVH